MSKSKSLTVIKNHQEESPRVINWLSLLFFFSLLTAFLVFQVSLDQQNQTKELWQDYSWQDLFPHPYPPSVLLWPHRELQHQPWWHLHIEIQNKYILCCHQALLETSHQGSNLCPKDTYISLSVSWYNIWKVRTWARAIAEMRTRARKYFILRQC